MIYTGQFAKCAEYQKDGLQTISIARFNPIWFTGPSIRLLAPSEDLLNRYHSNEISFGKFAKEFLYYLETLDPQMILSEINSLSAGYFGCVLLCYEKPTQFCHRTLVAQFLNRKLNLGVKERL